MEGDGADRFEAFVDALAEVFGHADRVRPLRDYCMGLLTPAERKSVEPLAAVTAPLRVSAQHQSLLHFVAFLIIVLIAIWHKEPLGFLAQFWRWPF